MTPRVGSSHDMIARAIGCSRPTLEARFGDELRNGVARKRKEVIAGLFKTAGRGNVSALKRLEELTSMVPEPEPKEKLGKKETANIEARTAHEGSSWGDLLH
jgi:hypothetical protein